MEVGPGRVPLLAHLPQEDLDRLSAAARIREIPAGTPLFREGEPGDGAYVVEHGEIEIVKASSSGDVPVAVRGPGDVLEEMALVEAAPRTADARARTDARVLVLERSDLTHVLETSPAAARSVLDAVLSRWRATGALLRQGERMARLGSQTAGVAHELNNPAAAVKRGAGHLAEAVERHAALERTLGRVGVPEQGAVAELGERARAAARSPRRIDALERTDAEADLETWLDDHDLPELPEVASALVELGYGAADLDRLADGLGPDGLAAVLPWVAASHELHALLAEVEEGARRISDIVGLLKAGSHPGPEPAPPRPVDIHQGLDDTLRLLRDKLEDGIEVRREYADDLPEVRGYGNELGQVWTNLVDNAAYAMGGTGTLTLRTRSTHEWVEVDVEDDGPGIPESIGERIFEPFFTTKPPGAGSGLGLDISYNIVVDGHGGDLAFSSRPGRTTFTVRLPRDPGAPGSASRS